MGTENSGTVEISEPLLEETSKIVESDSENIPDWKEQITIRGLVVSAVLGTLFCIITHKLNLTVGIIPSLNVAAGLLGFFFVKSWTGFMSQLGFSVKPFTKQENTVIQTCVVACYGLAFSGGFGSYLLAMDEKTYNLIGPDYPGNRAEDVKNPGLLWMMGFIFVVSFLGLFSLVPLRKVMVMGYKLTYPSGTATAMLINSFHTNTGAELARNQVGRLGKYLSISFCWSCFKWFFSGIGDACGFDNFPTLGLTLFKNTFYFDFSPTYVGCGLRSAEADRKEFDARDASSLSLPAGSHDAAETVADSGEGKLKMIVGLVKKCLGVKDIATMRISLPASLLEPIPNLEYWNYLDRPDVFAAINDSDDNLMRMVAVIRFTFTKDLKFVHGKICKPYNSVLGEYFRSHTSFKPLSYPADPNEPPIFPPHTLTSQNSSLVAPDQVPSETASVRSTTSTSGPNAARSHKHRSTSGAAAGLNGVGDGDDVNETEGSTAADERVRLVFLTEQVSHHPPISSFYITAPERGIEACGVDQISAKVVGTSVRVTPGSSNKGIFVNLTKGPGQGEKYRITHNSANVNGVLRGQFYATMSDSTIITCDRPGKDSLRAIIEYKEESWIGRSQFLVEGVIHTYNPSDPDECASWTKVKNVPQSRVVATFDGTWRGLIKWKRAGSSETHTLVDLSALAVLPKQVRPVEEQLPNESHRLWEHVTKNLLSKNYSEATRVKQIIEQKQRDDAAARKAKNEEFIPVYFEPDISNGQPVLTAEGRKVVEEELALAAAASTS